MIWGRNFFFAALFLPQICVSCYCDSVDPIRCQGAAFVSELCHLNRDSYRPDLAAFRVHPSTANVPKFLFMWSHGINPWYQQDTRHVVCFIPALASCIFAVRGSETKSEYPGTAVGYRSGNLSSLAMLQKTCMNFVKSMSKRWLCSWGTPGEHKSSTGWVSQRQKDKYAHLVQPLRSVVMTENKVAIVDAAETFYHISHLKSSHIKCNETAFSAYVCTVEALSSGSMA